MTIESQDRAVVDACSDRPWFPGYLENQNKVIVNEVMVPSRGIESDIETASQRVNGAKAGVVTNDFGDDTNTNGNIAMQWISYIVGAIAGLAGLAVTVSGMQEMGSNLKEYRRKKRELRQNQNRLAMARATLRSAEDSLIGLVEKYE